MRFCIVLDTNCLVRVLSRNSDYHIIWQSLLCGNIGMCVSTEILNEYAEVLERYTCAATANNVVNTILTNKHTKRFTPYYRFNLIEKDPDDNKFVDCAIASGATFLVTEDAHFNVLKNVPFPKVTVVDLPEFMAILTKDYS